MENEAGGVDPHDKLVQLTMALSRVNRDLQQPAVAGTPRETLTELRTSLMKQIDDLCDQLRPASRG